MNAQTMREVARNPDLNTFTHIKVILSKSNKKVTQEVREQYITFTHLIKISNNQF